MKDLITLIFLFSFATSSWSQSGGTCPKIQFSYDNAGNRIQRQYVTCFMDESNDAVALKSNTQNAQQMLKTGMKVFPNPNNGVFEVIVDNLQENTRLDLYDLTGRKLYSQNVITTNSKIDVSNLMTGIYMLLYRDSQKMFKTLKLIIE
jgi:Secretion system C-terminal sorting domain